jgi:SAM-dependent methyltransferase
MSVESASEADADLSWSDAIYAQFGCYDDFARFLEFAPVHADAASIQRKLQLILANGAETALGRTPPERVEFGGGNPRDGLLLDGFNPRQLALFSEIKRAAVRGENYLLFEAVTPFAQLVRGQYPNFITSEYAPTAEAQARIAPHPHVDMTDIPFLTGFFHMTVSADVLEHVADMDAAFRELARVTRPGGRLLATLPLAFRSRTSVRKAELCEGQVLHIADEPEYHEDPMRPGAGAVVFEAPGWDVLDRVKAAGFRDAFFAYISDYRSGILDGGVDGVFVLKAIR